MKKKFTEILKDAGREYSLSDSERANMRRVISEYARFKPAAEPLIVQRISFSWYYFVHRPLAMALVLVLVFGGSASYAAEGALPGDTLYTVKTMVNEPVRIALANTPEEKAEVKIELAERRIEEAVVLAAEGRLDDETQDSLTTAFDSYAGAAVEDIATIESEDAPAATELTSRFETRLAAHEIVLAELGGEMSRDEDDTRPAERLSQAIHARALAFAEVRERRGFSYRSARTFDATDIRAAAPAPEAATLTVAVSLVAAPEPDSATDTPAVEPEPRPQPSERMIERMEGAAERSLETAEDTLRDARLNDDSQERAEADIERARDLLESGREYLEEGADTDAYLAFEESLRHSQQAIVFIKAAPSLEKARTRSSRNREGDVRGAAQAPDEITTSSKGKKPAATTSDEAESTDKDEPSDSDQKNKKRED